MDNYDDLSFLDHYLVDNHYQEQGEKPMAFNINSLIDMLDLDVPGELL